MPRANAGAPQHKQMFKNKIKFISRYNLMLPNIYILHSGDRIKDTLPRNSDVTIY